MSYILVKFQNNWADEFDTKGFRITTKEKWDEHLQEVKFLFDKSGKQKKYFGTNEYISYGNFKEYKKSFEVTELSEEIAKELGKLFGLDIDSSYQKYGIFASIEEALANVEDDQFQEYIKKFGKPSWYEE